MRRALPLILAAGLIAGCGGGGDAATRSAPEPGTHTARLPPPSPGAGPAAAPARVIRRWADSLRHGDVDRASDLFALPAVVANGTEPLELKTVSAIRAFNTALPCGAVLQRTTRRGRFVVATFTLVDRVGPGAQPCTGKGDRASTAFRITDGRIREWRRVATPAEQVPRARGKSA